MLYKWALLAFLLPSMLYGAAVSHVELRTSAFFPSSHRFQTIYGHCQSAVEVEGGTYVSPIWEVWGNLSGHKTGPPPSAPVPAGYSTKLEMGNISVGIKYVYAWDRKTQLYVGLGPLLGRAILYNESSYHTQTIAKWAGGAVFKSGLRYMPRNTFVDLFFDYSYCSARFPKNINLGGIRWGIGIGMRI